MHPVIKGLSYLKVCLCDITFFTLNAYDLSMSTVVSPFLFCAKMNTCNALNRCVAEASIAVGNVQCEHALMFSGLPR